jgi:hypothetical protein
MLRPHASVVDHATGPNVAAFLQVDKASLAQTLSRALAKLSVIDLTVSAAPLEEVMSELFSRSREARDKDAR